MATRREVSYPEPTQVWVVTARRPLGNTVPICVMSSEKLANARIRLLNAAYDERQLTTIAGARPNFHWYAFTLDAKEE